MNLANKVTTKIVIISIKVSFHIKTNLANEIILYNFPPRPKPIYKLLYQLIQGIKSSLSFCFKINLQI